MNEDLRRLFEKHYGNMSLKIAREAGVHHTTLKRLVEKGEITQEMPGIYLLPDAFLDSFFALQEKYTKGIYSYETALFLHGLTDLNLGQFDMTFPAGSTRRGLEQHFIIPHYTSKEKHHLGVVQVKSPIGNSVVAYDMERTLCDIFGVRSNVDLFVRNEALKNYLTSDKRNVPKLRKYMREFRVTTDLKNKLEVLL
jgi:Predicted transcriptional regulator